MKRGIIILIFIICISSFISAGVVDIIFTQQIKSTYNLGDTIPIPVTIKTSSDINGLFQIDLICNGTVINFYKNGVNLVSGTEKTFDSSLVLIRGIIGDTKGTCKIKAILGMDYALSNEFKISDSLSITGSLTKKEFAPKESVSVTGKVIRETGENSNGFIDASLLTDNINQNITQLGTVNLGIFSVNLSLPSDLKAGNYILRLRAFEKNSDGIITNNGFADYNISIRQVPTNLEIMIDNKYVMPGSSAKVKAILHDQTGEPINAVVFITIKDQNNKILEQREIQTNEFLEYPIRTNEPPAEWKVFAVSNQLTAEDGFQIKVNENVDIQVVNKTILITNIGNVPYNRTVLVKVGETSLNIPVMLSLGKSKKYVLSAPDGEYKVDVKTENGDEISNVISLTGGAIDVREISGGHYTILAWILMILILGFVAFTIFRKIYKKPFVGKKMNFNFKKKDSEEMPVLGANSITRPANKGELSLSIKGEKQEASVICLKVKNLRDMKSGRGSPAESIRKSMDLAEENKAVSYENQDYLFFIFAPTKTRTFKNEKTALEIAKKIQDILTEHNKRFNQKVEFGISLNYGTIVAKLENGIFKFMTLGTLITSAKKIASLSKGEVLIGEKMNDLLRLNIRTEKHVRDGVSVFSVKEIKRENEEARKFIDRFMQRQGKG